MFVYLVKTLTLIDKKFRENLVFVVSKKVVGSCEQANTHDLQKMFFNSRFSTRWLNLRKYFQFGSIIFFASMVAKEMLTCNERKNRLGTEFGLISEGSIFTFIQKQINRHNSVKVDFFRDETRKEIPEI